MRGAPRSTRVRARCAQTKRKRSLDEELALQLKKSSKAILQAQIDRAKEGSLQHAKWLWARAEQLRLAEQKPPEVSLAELLMGGIEPAAEPES